MNFKQAMNVRNSTWTLQKKKATEIPLYNYDYKNAVKYITVKKGKK